MHYKSAYSRIKASTIVYYFTVEILLLKITYVIILFEDIYNCSIGR